METINTYSEDEFESMTLRELTEFNNRICSVMGTQGSKRFSTKPLAINRVIKNQDAFVKYMETQKPVEEPADKPKSSAKKVDREQRVRILKGDPKEGSTEFVMFQCVKKNNGEATIGQLITCIKTEYDRPSGQPIEDRIILRRLRKAVNAGRLEIVKGGK